MKLETGATGVKLTLSPLESDMVRRRKKIGAVLKAGKITGNGDLELAAGYLNPVGIVAITGVLNLLTDR